MAEINLPRLTMDGSPLPPALRPLDDHLNITRRVLTEFAESAAKINRDGMLSPTGRAEKLRAAADLAAAEVAKHQGSLDRVAGELKTRTANALRKSTSQYDSARLLVAADHLARLDKSTRLGKLSAALQAGELETLAAFHNAPAALDLFDGVGGDTWRERVRNTLIDAGDPTLRPDLDAAEFAAGRLKLLGEAFQGELRDRSRVR